jgi:hypothetical protein
MSKSPTAIDRAITDLDDDAARKFLKEHVAYNNAGVTFNGEFTFEEWKAGYDFHTALRNRSRWIIGDFLVAGQRFGERYTQAIEITGRTYSDLTTLASVCERFSDHNRRRHELAFDYHSAVAYLPYQEADRLLDECIKLHWDRETLRDKVATLNELAGRPTKRKKKGIGVKILPPAANQTTIDVEATVEKEKPKPLFWNGHTLATKDNALYYGSERIDPPNDDACAHHHKFPHAQGLLRWLRENDFTDVPESRFLTAKERPTLWKGHQLQAGRSNSQTGHMKLYCGPILIELDEYEKVATELGFSNTAELVQHLLENGHQYSRNQTPPPATPKLEGISESATAPSASQPPAPEPTGRRTGPPGEASDPAAQQSLEQQAEEHIRAFNDLSQKIDWAGFPKLKRSKWLQKLLLRADEVIDILSNTPLPK